MHLHRWRPRWYMRRALPAWPDGSTTAERGLPLAQMIDEEPPPGSDRGVRPEPEGPDERRERLGGPGFRQRTSDLLNGLLDREGPLRRGQEMVTGVTQATKDELMRIVSAEVRSFLDKMDAVDLLQQVISGLTVDVSMKIRFSREPGRGGLQSHVERSEAEVGSQARPRTERAERTGASDSASAGERPTAEPDGPRDGRKPGEPRRDRHRDPGEE